MSARQPNFRPFLDSYLMSLPIVTLATAASLAVINLWLALRIVRVRLKDDILIGDGENDVLAGKMRAHANLVEYAPFVLILMGLINLPAVAKRC